MIIRDQFNLLSLFQHHQIIGSLGSLERTCPKGQLVSLLQPVTQTPLPPRRFPLLDGPLFELLLGLENVIKNLIQDPQFHSYFLIIKDNYSSYSHVIKDHYILHPIANLFAAAVLSQNSPARQCAS